MIWLDMPVLGMLLLIVFAWQSWRRALQGASTKARHASRTRQTFELDVVPQDNGVFRATLHDWVLEPTGSEDGGSPAPSEIDLPTSWSAYPLRLATHNNAVEFQPPPPKQCAN